jgi:hypothetical protein
LNPGGSNGGNNYLNIGIGATGATKGVPYLWSSGTTSNGSAGNFAIGDDGSPTLFIQGMSLGNVGIGTTSPVHPLQVVGTIGATEVIVSSTGADYVFKPSYKLAPLKQVAAYIETNHHLPEIPSAAEVEQKGVSLGEMQTKLLAKIEELTLHMIQEDKRNSRLERQNRQLLKRIARIEASSTNRISNENGKHGN